MELDLLRMVSIFRELDDAELEAFHKCLNLRETRPKEQILEEGMIVTQFYIICDGVFHIRRLASKREMLLGRQGAGGFFGEINLFDPGVATASIYSMSQGLLAVIDYDEFRQFMTDHPATGYKIVSAIMRETARRLRTTNARLVNSVYWSAQPSGVS